MPRLRALASLLWEKVIRFALKFGVVGAVGFVVDLAVFNLLRTGALGDRLAEPLTAAAISFAVATVCNWVGNRYWTFRERRRADALREFAEFAVVAIGGLLITLLCVWVSHYLLGFTSLLADNIAKNVVGLALGTAFRFVLYRFWVYGSRRAGTPAT